MEYNDVLGVELFGVVLVINLRCFAAAVVYGFSLGEWVLFTLGFFWTRLFLGFY